MILEKGAPFVVNEIYDKSLKKYAAKGDTEAKKRAIREVQLAGWYKGPLGWSKRHSDISKKVVSREAIAQPDGTFVIEDIPVFYPNAVKGPHLPFTANDIRGMIRNTNAAINAGSQKPGVLEGHPHPDQAFIGEQPDNLGAAVNWREHPEKPGWAVCDLVSVQPQIVRRLKEKKLTGLSAGLAKDAVGLNKRFGHVAILGGTTQALSHLPATEIFTSGNSVCFSADYGAVAPRMKPMRLKKDCEANLAKMHDAYSSYKAAQACFEAGEPGAEGKMSESINRLKDVHDKGVRFEMEEGDEPMAPGSDPGDGDAAGVPGGAGGEPGALSPMSDTTTPPAPAEYSAPDVDFGDDPEAHFNALQSFTLQQNEQLGKMAKIIKAQQLKLRAQENKASLAQFSATVEGLRKEGRHLPDAKIIQKDWELCFQANDPQAAITHRIEAYRAIPKERTPATVNKRQPLFDATSANRSRNATENQTFSVNARDLEDIAPNVSQEDLAWANIGANTPTFSAEEL